MKMGTTAAQKKLFFNLRKAKSRISALDEGDMRPEQVQTDRHPARRAEQDVVDMNRRLGGDASLNAPIREDGDSGEWQDWLVDDSASQETRLAEREESRTAAPRCAEALTVLNDRERHIFEARRLEDEPTTLEELAAEFGVSRERVRQIEVRAFEKVQKAVKNGVAAMEAPPGPRGFARRRRALSHFTSPWRGGVGRDSGRAGVAALPPFHRKKICGTAATPPRTACGSPTLPLQGKVLLLPGGEGVAEGAVAGGAFFDRDDRPLAVVVDDGNIEPPPAP